MLKRQCHSALEPGLNPVFIWRSFWRQRGTCCALQKEKARFLGAGKRALGSSRGVGSLGSRALGGTLFAGMKVGEAFIRGSGAKERKLEPPAASRGVARGGGWVTPHLRTCWRLYLGFSFSVLFRLFSIVSFRFAFLRNCGRQSDNRYPRGGG